MLRLLIVPEGIEIEIFKKTTEKGIAFNRTRRN